MKRRLLFPAALAAAALLGTAGAATPAAPHAPDAVKNALRILAYVQDDMARKLPTHAYARLPHESQEFEEASAAMREAVNGEPADLRGKVDSALSKALQASRTVAEVSKSNDEMKITAAVKAVDAELQHLYALFPEALRPVPGQLGTGPGRGAGPPPGLR